MASQVAFAFRSRCGVIRIGFPFRTNPAALTVEANDRLKFVIGLVGSRPGNTYSPVRGACWRAASKPLLRGSRRCDEAVFGVHPPLGWITANPPCMSIASHVRLRASPRRHPVSARNAISTRNRSGAASISRTISSSVGMSTLFRPSGICSISGTADMAPFLTPSLRMCFRVPTSLLIVAGVLDEGGAVDIRASCSHQVRRPRRHPGNRAMA